MKNELNNDSYVFEKYNDFSREVKEMLAQRLLLEEMRLRIEKLPLCREMTALELLQYFSKVREQYLITRRADQLSSTEQLDLVKNLVSVEIDRSYPVELNLFLAGLTKLRLAGMISFNSFIKLPGNVQGNLLDIPTIWSIPGDASSMVGVIEDLGRISNLSVENPNPVGSDRLLRLAHFWASVEEMTEELL